ncbi:hypothetical protein TWF281_000348 [Arthrobotrys megalospora]
MQDLNKDGRVASSPVGMLYVATTEGVATCWQRSTLSKKAVSITSSKFDVVNIRTFRRHFSLSRDVKSELTIRIASAGSLAEAAAFREEAMDSTSSVQRAKPSPPGTKLAQNYRHSRHQPLYPVLALGFLTYHYAKELIWCGSSLGVDPVEEGVHQFAAFREPPR